VRTTCNAAVTYLETLTPTPTGEMLTAAIAIPGNANSPGANRGQNLVETRAAEEMRGIGNYVAWLITRDLARKPRRRRTGAKLSDKREP